MFSMISESMMLYLKHYSILPLKRFIIAMPMESFDRRLNVSYGDFNARRIRPICVVGVANKNTNLCACGGVFWVSNPAKLMDVFHGTLLPILVVIRTTINVAKTHDYKPNLNFIDCYRKN